MHVITWIMGWRPLNGRLGLRMAAWSQFEVCGRRLSLRPIGVLPLCLWHKSAASTAVCGFAFAYCSKV